MLRFTLLAEFQVYPGTVQHKTKNRPFMERLFANESNKFCFRLQLLWPIFAIKSHFIFISETKSLDTLIIYNPILPKSLYVRLFPRGKNPPSPFPDC